MQRKKTKKMTTYTVTINEKSKILVKLLEALSIAGATVEKKKTVLMSLWKTLRKEGYIPLKVWMICLSKFLENELLHQIYQHI